jgi:hypothetical protein
MPNKPEYEATPNFPNEKTRGFILLIKLSMSFSSEGYSS